MERKDHADYVKVGNGGDRFFQQAQEYTVPADMHLLKIDPCPGHSRLKEMEGHRTAEATPEAP